MSTTCVFCSIVAGETSAEIVLDEPDFVAFLDARPVFKGHTLLVPREHVVTLLDLPAGLRDGFLEAAQRLARAVVDGLGAQGSFVAMNNIVSQSVAHLHLHVVPRTKGDDCAASSGRAPPTPRARRPSTSAASAPSCQENLTDPRASGLLDTVNDATELSESAASNDPEQGLAAVRALRALADRLEAVQVRNAREQGWSWQAIADVLQISRQAVHQKHSRDSRP